MGQNDNDDEYVPPYEYGSWNKPDEKNEIAISEDSAGSFNALQLSRMNLEASGEEADARAIAVNYAEEIFFDTCKCATTQELMRSGLKPLGDNAEFLARKSKRLAKLPRSESATRLRDRREKHLYTPALIFFGISIGISLPLTIAVSLWGLLLCLSSAIISIFIAMACLNARDKQHAPDEWQGMQRSFDQSLRSKHVPVEVIELAAQVASKIKRDSTLKLKHVFFVHYGDKLLLSAGENRYDLGGYLTVDDADTNTQNRLLLAEW